MQRSRNWVYKWTRRGQGQDYNSEWYHSHSRRPHTSPNKVDKHIEKEVVDSRKRLQKRDTPETKYSFCGAVGIHYDLDKKGFDDKPSLSTINRIIKRNGLVENKERSENRNGKKIYYPTTKALHPNFLHQFDIITPLYISGYGKVVSLNRIDVFTSHANLGQFDAKNIDNVLDFIIEDWKMYGIPRYLQVDNEGAFRGGLHHPRSFGKFIRFCLNFGVQLIFIPYNEPWRNGHIESLNGRFQKYVWASNRFKDLSGLRKESKKFENNHNEYQTYRIDNFRKTKDRSFTTTYLPKGFSFDVQEKLPITTGLVHFIRRVDEDGEITLLNESFKIDKKYSFEYVWAVINTREQSLSFFHKENKDSAKELIEKKTYEIREPIKNRISVNKFK